MMKVFDKLFYIIFFACFMLPSSSKYFVGFGFANLTLLEICLFLLCAINLLCTERNKVLSKQMKIVTASMLISIVFSQFLLKPLIYNSTIYDGFQSLRIGLPLVLIFSIALSDIRVNLLKLWNVLLLAVTCSVFISIINILYPLPIYRNPIENAQYFLDFHYSGRIYNIHAAFGLLAAYLLLTKKTYKINETNTQRIMLFVSVIALILAFNRTLIAALLLLILLETFKNVSLKLIVKIFITSTALLFVILFVYNNFDPIKEQVDRRIIDPLSDNSSVLESTYDGNRSYIVAGIKENLIDGYWVIGLPYKTKMFSYNEETAMPYSDTTLVNILLIYGFIPFFIFIVLCYAVFLRPKYLYAFRGVFLIYIICSFNVDLFMRSIGFLYLFILIGLMRENRVENVK